MEQIRVIVAGKERAFEKGAAAGQIFDALFPGREPRPLAATLYGRTRPLNWTPENDCELQILDYSDDEGRRIYERSLRFVLLLAVRDVLPGARVQLGRFELELLAPAHATAGDNGDSLVWLLVFDADGDGVPEQRGLLTGDAEEQELAAVAARTGRVSFVKLGHHGSAGCMSAAELAALRPSLALIGVGEGNRYGHPHASTLALMRAAGVRVLRTDTQGDLRLLFSADALGVATQRGSP